MQIDAIVATLQGVSFARLNDRDLMERALKTAVDAGGFTQLHLYIHAFAPQGLTGTVVLSESHIALHSWPEDGALFVDLATCSGMAATEAAFRALCDIYEATDVERHDVSMHSRRRRRVVGEGG